MPKPDYKPGQVLRAPANWKGLRFYHKTDTLFQLTAIFCKRFLPQRGDRTVDQMVQAARSGKQNIVEGSEDGKTSTEMEMKLLNVARSSIDELREDYQDYINIHDIELWESGHPRFKGMQDYTRSHNEPEDYIPLAERWNDEEFANICLSLCYQTDAMINNYLRSLEKTFVTEGGIKERMHKARTGYRAEQDEQLRRLEAENASLKAALEDEKARYEDLKVRAISAYNAQQEEIRALKAQLAALRKG